MPVNGTTSGSYFTMNSNLHVDYKYWKISTNQDVELWKTAEPIAVKWDIIALRCVSQNPKS